MNKYLGNPDIRWKLLALLFALFMFNTPFATQPYLVSSGPSWLGLDVSWQMTLNYALLHKWEWGTDIIYTYGPLGFLSTRIGWGISRWVFLVFDVFLVVQFYFMFRDFIIFAKDKFIAAIIVFGITLLMGTNHGTDLSWVLTVFVFYWMYKSYTDAKVIYFVWMGISILLCFFIKLNAGLIGIILLFAHLGNLLLYKRIGILKALIVIGSIIISVVLFALLFHVSLPDYIKGAFEIIKGYNDAMHIGGSDYMRLEQNIITLFFLVILSIGIWLVYIRDAKRFSLLFFAGVVFIYVFLLRKQAIVRNDPQHYYEFFTYACLVFLCGIINLVDGKYHLYSLRSLLVSVVFSLFILALFDGNGIDKAFERRYLEGGAYWQQFSEYNKLTYLNQSHKRYIPETIKNKIGKETIDIFPWDSEYLIENNLNYHPRPVFQSFSAYTEDLSGHNYTFYNNNAPRFLCYDYESIDGRYPFNDDLLTNFFICKNYTFADSFTSNERWRLLLEKKPVMKALDISVAIDTVASLNTKVPVKWVMMMKVSIKETIWGKMQSIFYTAQPIMLEITRGNGEKVQYKVSREILKSGIMVDRWIQNTNDYLKYMLDKNTLDPISDIEIKADTKYYEKEISIKYINIK